MLVPGALAGLMAATTFELNLGVLGVLGTFIVAIVGAWAVWRKIEPERSKLQAEAARLRNESSSIEDRIRESLLDDIEQDRQRARTELAETRAETAQARQDTAEAQAELAHQIAAWEKERASYLEELRAKDRLLHEKDRRIEVLERKVDHLQSEIRTLRVAMNMDPDRRTGLDADHEGS